MSEELQQIIFPSEQIQKILQQTIQSILGTKTYEEKQVPHWINQINQTIMEKLIISQKPFKYLINTLIMQRKGASVVISQSNYWDAGLDSCFTIVWPKEKPGKAQQSKNTIQAMVSVYALTTLNSNSLLKNQI